MTEPSSHLQSETEARFTLARPGEVVLRIPQDLDFEAIRRRVVGTDRRGEFHLGGYIIKPEELDAIEAALQVRE